MTPKEKAEELVKLYYNSINPNAPDYFSISWKQAKQCALIAVDEILEIVSSDESMLITELQYWQQVKQEINNL
jgi:hypothetical protein